MYKIAVIGTGGKTTTCTFLKSIFEQAGLNVVYMNSLNFYKDSIDVPNTDVLIVEFHMANIFNVALPEYVGYVFPDKFTIMESASKVKYDLVVVTDISVDRCDILTLRRMLPKKYMADQGVSYGEVSNAAFAAWATVRIHKIMASIISKLETTGKLIINNQNDATEYTNKISAINTDKNKADDLTFVDLKWNGFEVDISGTPVSVKLMGKQNLINAYLAIRAGARSGLVTGKDIKTGVENVINIKNRSEIIFKPTALKQYLIMINMCDTADKVRALSNHLKVHAKKIKVVLSERGAISSKMFEVVSDDNTALESGQVRMIGGMTALTRRLFAEFVGTFADHIVITDGNYYYEDPQVIRDELYAGLTTHPSTTIVPDRKLALKQAVSSLKKGDALLILGDTVRGYWHRHYGIEETMEHDAIYNEAYYTFDDKEFILGLL